MEGGETREADEEGVEDGGVADEDGCAGEGYRMHVPQRVEEGVRDVQDVGEGGVLDVGQLDRDADMAAEAYRPNTCPRYTLQLSPRAYINVPEQMGACSRQKGARDLGASDEVRLVEMVDDFIDEFLCESIHGLVVRGSYCFIHQMGLLIQITEASLSLHGLLE